jgi:hypothetical protein
MRIGHTVAAGILLGVLAPSTPALATGWEASWHEATGVCVVRPPGYRMAIAMREDAGQRQARVSVAARLEEGGVVYLRVDRGPQHTSKENSFSGSEAQAILNELWTGKVVELGSSTGIRPIQVSDRVTTQGLREAVTTCTQKLGWSRPPSAGALPDDEGLVSAPQSSSEGHREPAENASPAESASAPSSCDFADELRKLAALRSEGLLTDEEFDQLKERLLARCRSELESTDDTKSRAPEAPPVAEPPDSGS